MMNYDLARCCMIGGANPRSVFSHGTPSDCTSAVLPHLRLRFETHCFWIIGCKRTFPAYIGGMGYPLKLS